MGFLDRVPLASRFTRRDDEDEEYLEEEGDRPSGPQEDSDDASAGGGGFLGRLRSRLRRGSADDLELDEDSADDDLPVGSLAGVVAAPAAARAPGPLQGRSDDQPEARPQSPVAVYVTGETLEADAAAPDQPDTGAAVEDGEETDDGPEDSSGDLSMSLRDIFRQDVAEDATLKDLAASVEHVPAAALAAELNRFLEEQQGRWE